MANRVKLYQKSTTSKDDLFPKKKEISTFLIGNAYSKDPFISDESKLRDRLMQKVGPRPSILEVSNNWLERNIKLQLEARPFILTNGIVKLSNVHAESGTIDIAGKKGILTPRYCRDNGITYHNEIKADVTYYPNINPLQDKDVAVKTSGHLSTAKEAMKEEKTKKDVSLGSVPIMLRSKHCILSSLDEGQCLNLGECGNDPGGYYIINGGERSIITQESLRTGLFMLWNNEETGKVENRITCVVDHGTTVVTMVLGSKWDTLKIGTYHTGKNKHIPLYVAFGFLGYNEDNATNLIAHFIPKEYAFAVLMYLQSSIIRGRSVGNDIVGYLSRKLDKQKSTSQNIDKTSGAITAMMQQDLFSHIKTLNAKARALAFMTAQTVMNVMGKRGPDNRDSWGIKKLSAPGRVMEVKLNTIWTNVIKVTQLAAAKTTSSNGLATFISSFPDATVTTDFTKAFTTSWSTKAGQAAEAVTDSLKRDTPASTLSQFTRITAPTSRKGKKSSLREVQQSQLSFICLSGDSLVLMGDGYTSRRIDTLKNKDEVMTADPDSLELSSSGIKNYFSKMPKKMLEIRTISGRSLKCDPAHPFLVSKKGKKVWIKAKDLKEGNNLFIKHYTTTVSKKGGKALVLNKEDFDQKYADELEELGFFEPLSQGTMAILAKLAGAIWTDGNIYKGKNGRKGWDVSFCVGAEEDANEINADIKELGFEPNPPKYKEDHQNKAGRQIIHHTWKVRKGGAFAALMVALGIPVGNKTYCEKKMPKWIIKASPYVKKEFLSGFQGGDGGRIFIKLTAQSSTVQMNMTQQVSCVDTSDSGIKFMEKMVKMYKDFGIDSAVKVSDTPEGKKVVALNILGSNENLNRYADMIEYRYCCEKRIASALPIEFLKYKLTRLQERRDAINKAIELDEEGELNKKQIAEEVGISYGMINKYIAKHKRKEEINITMPTGTINYPEFKERFFIEGKDLVIGEIESIKKIEVEEVYDFETISDNHDFFANGILVSNCSSESPEGEGSMAATAMMLMEDGSHMSIRDIVKGMGVRCMTFNKAEGKLDTTYVDKRWCFKTDGVNRTLYRITSITGQSVEATDDHPFFSQHGWTETRHLDIKEHKLALVTWQEDVSKEVEADIIMDSDLFKNSLHEQHIKNMIITKHCKKLNEILFPLYANDHRVPILARMYGYCVSNASITNNKSKSSMSLMLSFRTREDGINFIYDAEFLGFKSNPEIFLPKSPGAKHDFVKYSGILASLFVAFGFWGKNIPDWITEGSTTTKREFLAGLNSGKGECIKYIEDKLIFTEITQILEDSNIVSQLRELYTSLDVYFGDNIEVEKNTFNYLTKIGYRYNREKSGSTLLIEKYLLAKAYKQFILTYSEFVALIDIPVSSSTILHNDQYAFFPIDKIERIADDMVYDVTVENDDHNFIANSFCSHNCGLVKNFAMMCGLSIDRDADDFYIAMKGETKGYENKLPQHYGEPSKELDWSEWVYIIDSEDPALKHIKDIVDYKEYDPKTVQFIDESKKDYEVRLHLIREEKILEKFPYPIFFNGSPAGWCRGREVETFLKTYRLFGLVSLDACIFFNNVRNCLEIDTTGGRCIRPLLVVHENKLVIDETENGWDLSVEELFTNGCVTYVDSREQEKIMLAEETKDVREYDNRVTSLKEAMEKREKEVKKINEIHAKTKVQIDIRHDSVMIRLHTELKEMLDYPYTHCEVHPISQYGNLAGMIPEANKTQGPRITYQASMGKQALNQYHTKHQERFDTTFKVMMGPTLPIFQSEIAAPNGLDVMPAGDNIIKAYYAHPDNPEDGIVVNEDTINKAKKFKVDKYVTHKVIIKRGAGNKDSREENRRPPPEMFRKDDTRFHALDEYGIPGVGLYLNKGDAVVGKVKITKQKLENASLYIGVGEEGYVDRVLICKTILSNIIIKVKIRQTRDQIEGDKLASRYSQKGTISRKCKREELPRVRFGPNKGLVADFYNNPHAVPSRMPIGELDEMITSKASLYDNTRVDATTFNYLNMDYYRNILKREWDRYYVNNPEEKAEYDTYIEKEVLYRPWKKYQREHPTIKEEFYTYLQKGILAAEWAEYKEQDESKSKNSDVFLDFLSLPATQKSIEDVNYDDFLSQTRIKALIDKLTYEDFLALPSTQRLVEKYSFTNGYEIMEIPIREVPKGGVTGDGPKHLVPTGEYQPCRRHIFMGPCFTQVLRHQVLDKIQMRDEGTVAATTHQPIGGRARAGGQRFGEMERDALISHGATSMMLERLMTTSDAHTCVLCAIDGHIPESNVRKGEFYCGYCKMMGREGIPAKVTLPFVFIYLLRLLQLAMIDVTFNLVPATSLGTGKELLEDNFVA